MRKRRSSRWLPYALAAIALTLIALLIPGLDRLIGLGAILVAICFGMWSFLEARQKARRWAVIGSFYALSPEQFEEHVSRCFEYLGYITTLTPRVGDQGVDVIAEKGNDLIAIQCKRYSDHAPNAAVQAVHAGAMYYGCNRALLVCLGGFSRSAIELASSTSVELMDGAEYADLVHRLSPTEHAAVAIPSRGRFLTTVLLFGFGVGAIYLDFSHPQTALVNAHPELLTQGGRLIRFALAILAVGILLRVFSGGRRRRYRR